MMRIVHIPALIALGCSGETSSPQEPTTPSEESPSSTPTTSTGCTELTFYVDADSDGFGDPGNTVSACTQPEGTVEDGTDCDDTSELANPLGEEVCDGLDNDCDGQVDHNTVPGDFDSIQAAIDALPHDAEACVAAGIWTEPFDFGDHQITITGAGGPEHTTFDLSGLEGPFVTATGGEDAGCLATVRGFTITGIDRTPVKLDVVSGAFLRASDASVYLDELVFTGNRLAMEDFGGFAGGLMSVTGGELSVTDTVVEDLEVTGQFDLSAPILYAQDASVLLGGVTLRDTVVTGKSQKAGCSLTGLMIHAVGSDVEVYDTEVRDLSVDLHCDGTFTAGVVAYLESGTLVSERWTLEDIDAHTTGRWASVGAMIQAGWGTSHITDLTLSGITALAQSPTSAGAFGGLVLLGDSTLQGFVAHGNVFEASSDLGNASAGGLLTAIGASVMSHVDLRGNTVDASSVRGGMVLLETYGSDESLALSNAIVAGNTVQADFISGGVMSADANGGPITMSHLDLVGNTVLSSGQVWGGALSVTDDHATTVHSSNISGNDIDGKQVQGAALWVWDETALTWTHTNVFGNTGGSAFHGLTDDPSAAHGNLVAAPLHTDLTATDPLAWDLTLQPASPLVDVGDGEALDADGSPSDIGAYGGPLGASW
ncbi:MAG: putative metal-binding motif-containing protein [Myxococcales bacterium]|nr:putative metal-binding motif-containing protein [Myxococcales bacterium]